MSSEILSVSEKTRQQFLQQNITYRDSSRVGASVEKYAVFQAIFYNWRRKNISPIFKWSCKRTQNQFVFESIQDGAQNLAHSFVPEAPSTASV